MENTYYYELVNPSCADLVQMYIDAEKERTGTVKRINQRILEAKFRILIHTILKAQIAMYDKDEERLGECRLHADTLNHTIGSKAGKMIDLLIEKGILYRSYYIPGKRSYGYQINEDYPYVIKKIAPDEMKMYKYENRVIESIRRAFKKAEQREKQWYADTFCDGDTSFIDRYEQDLSLLNVTSPRSIYDFADARICVSSKQKDYYRQISHKLVEKYSRITFDNRARIYQRLTNCAKDLRGFLNIDFEVDNHNSQPLLFGLLLVDHYKIAPALLDVFCAAIDENYSGDCKQPIVFHHSYRNRPFTIEDEDTATNITREYVSKLNDIPYDVWKYLYSVMKGKLWDMFITEGILRDAAKESLFKQVFFRKKTSYGRVHDVYGKCGKAFQRLFPNVSRTITLLIKNNEENWLANEITRIESQIMRDVLKKVWERGFKAITIHDAIVTIKQADNNLPKSVEEREEIVKDCFREVFNERHLLCSPAAEVYKMPSIIK